MQAVFLNVMIVQVYEIQTRQEAEECVDVGVDHVGSVILSKDHWRQPELKQAIRSVQGAGKKSTLIPLFFDRETIYKSLDYYGPDFVHFCNNLTDDNASVNSLKEAASLQTAVRQHFPEIAIMRSIPIPQQGQCEDFPSLEIARKLEPVTDLFLTDTWLDREPVSGFIGITGMEADWERARALVVQSNIPVILAGGLSPENVYQALLKIRPAGADSCSKTNKLDHQGRPIRFKKDLGRVASFVANVREAERQVVKEE